MNKLSRIFNREHQPDAVALSALADGELDSTQTGALEAHVAGCAACSAELAGMRQVRSLLQALPEQDAPRSFRLREADVSPAPRQAPQQLGLLRLMPALSAAAAIVFVVALSADLTSGGGNGDGDLAAFGQRSAMESASDAATGGEGRADDDAEAPGVPGAAPSGMQPDATAGTAIAADGAVAETPPIESEAAREEATIAAAGTLEYAGDADETTGGATQPSTEQARAADDDDGAGLLRIVWIAAMALALAAGGAWVAARLRTREGTA